MTYPNVAAPALVPGARARRPRLLGRRPHVPGVDRPARRRRRRVRVLRRPAVRQRPAALRPPAHRLREGRRAALPDDARAAGRAPLRLGLPRPARRGGGREGARHQRPRARSPTSASTSSTTPAAPACCATPTSGSATSPARPAGSTSSNDYKTLDPSYMESVMWAFKTLWDKGWSTRASACCRTAGAARRRSANTETRMDDVLPRPPGPGAHRARSSCDEPASAILAWTTTPWTLPSNLALAVGPDIEYARDGGRRASATSSPRRASARTTKRARRRHARRHAARAPSSSAARYKPLFPFFADTPNALPRARRRLRDAPRTAPAWCTWRPASARTTRTSCNAVGIPTVCPMDEHGRFTAEVAAVGGRARVRRQPATSSGR